MGIDPMNKISIIIRILFAVTLFQQEASSLFGTCKEFIESQMVSPINSLKVLDVQNGWEARSREGPPYFVGHF
jgi:hypothetical protein